MYWIAQILGGIAGALVGGIIGGVTIAPSVGKNSHFMQAFIAELGKCLCDNSRAVLVTLG